MISEAFEYHIYKYHVANEDVRNKIHCAIDNHYDHLSVVKMHKPRRYGNISSASGMDKTILQGTVREEDRERVGKTI